MTTGNTTLLGLALPVDGELDGTWGDVVNNSITSLVDSAVAGTTTLPTDADVTLTDTVLASNQARQAVLLWTASNGATTRNITAPARSKPYIVINAGTGSIVLRGAGPTTGVTILSGEKCLAAWNGSDFVKISGSSGDVSVRNLTVTGNLSVEGNSTLGNASGDAVTINGNANFANVNPTLTAGTANGVAYLNGSKVLTTGSTLTFDGTNLGLKNTANLADNYNTLEFSSDFTPSLSVDTNESGRINFLNKSPNGTQQLGTSIQASAVTTNLFPALVYGKLKLHAYNISSGTIQDTSYLELFANSTSSLLGNAGLDLRSGSATSTSKSMSFYIDDGDSEAYRITSTGTSIWYPGFSEGMRLTSTGLGIGTSSPSSKLDVSATSADSVFSMTVSGVQRWQQKVESSTGNWLLYDQTAAATRLTVNTSGNLGLGVTPSAWSGAVPKALQFSGNAAVNAGAALYATTNAYYNGTNWIYQNTDLASYYIQNAGQHKWYNAPSGTAGNAITFTQAMTLDASGNLLVGTTSASNRLAVVGSSSSEHIAQFRDNRSDGASGAGMIVFDRSGSTVGSISTTTSSTSYNTSSDYRLKHDITPMTGALAKVSALKPCTYKWNLDGSAGEGFIAHELAEVCPAAVTGEKDAVDAEGKPVYQGIDTSFLVATLTAAIQEQQAIINAQQAALNQFKARLDAANI